MCWNICLVYKLFMQEGHIILLEMSQLKIVYGKDFEHVELHLIIYEHT